jgi:cysteine desulfurase/selenocysteine lyase
MYDVYKIREDFSVLGVKINGKPNTFLDTAASAQKQKRVIS